MTEPNGRVKAALAYFERQPRALQSHLFTELSRIPGVSRPTRLPRAAALGRGHRGGAARRGHRERPAARDPGRAPLRLRRLAARSRARPRSCSTGTTTCSPRAAPRSGSRRPSSPTERDGRLYGRGTADDKAGVMAHVAAVASYLKCRGRAALQREVRDRGRGGDRLREPRPVPEEVPRACWTPTSSCSRTPPTSTPASRRSPTSCAASCKVDVEVQCLERPVHSGMWGGPVPDPVQILCKLIAGLTDKDGALNIPGLYEMVAKPGKAAAGTHPRAALRREEVQEGGRHDEGHDAARARRATRSTRRSGRGRR